MRTIAKITFSIGFGLVVFLHSPLSAEQRSTEQKPLEGLLHYGGVESPEQIPLIANRRATLPGDYIRFEGSRQGDGVSARTFEISIRYKLWTLMGSSLWSFESRYSQFPEMSIYRNDRRVMTIVPLQAGDAAEVRVEDRGDHARVLVPGDWMERVRLYAFNFSASVNLPGYENILIYKVNPGVTAQPGEWGWDVPGNPAWDRMFVDRDALPETRSRGHPLHPRDLPNEAWLDANVAKELYQALLESNQKEPFSPVSIWDLQINLIPLLSAIRREEPEAFRYYYRSSWDQQANALISSVVNQAESLRDGDGGIHGNEEFERRRELTDEALGLFGSDLDPELLEIWQEVQKEIDQSELRGQLRRLQKALQHSLQRLEGGEEDVRSQLSESLLAEAEAMGDRIDAVRQSIDPQLLERWEQLERIIDMKGEEEPPEQDLVISLGGGVVMELVWVSALNAWVGKYEVTNAEFRRFRAGHDSGAFRGQSLNGERQPVVRVSYDDAVAFIDWLNGRSGLAGQGMRARLPTGDEWTAIAQCGTSRRYPWGDQWPPTRGNYSDITARETLGTLLTLWSSIEGYRDGFAVTSPVEQSSRNEWGLYGAGGNVWEWTSEQKDGARVMRGASWFDLNRSDLRVETRFARPPSDQGNRIGFRVLLEGGA